MLLPRVPARFNKHFDFLLKMKNSIGVNKQRFWRNAA
jgi:hypothetical protein